MRRLRPEPVVTYPAPETSDVRLAFPLLDFYGPDRIPDLGRAYAIVFDRFAPVADILQKARCWRLLLQIDSVEEAGMSWGGLGRIYFLIREDDLAARRFDLCWPVLQCD